MKYKDLVLQAARSVDSSINSLDPFERWGRVKIHGVGLPNYMERGSGGLQKLIAEVEGAQVPARARWLGGATTHDHHREGRSTYSSVVLAVRGEAAAASLCKRGARLAGRRHEVEPFEEPRPDAFCSRCYAWDHTVLHCTAVRPSAPSARGTTRRQTIGARWRGAGSRRVTHVLTWWPNAGTAVARTPPRPTCSQRREQPGRRPRGGDRLPHHAGSEALCLLLRYDLGGLGDGEGRRGNGGRSGGRTIAGEAGEDGGVASPAGTARLFLLSFVLFVAPFLLFSSGGMGGRNKGAPGLLRLLFGLFVTYIRSVSIAGSSRAKCPRSSDIYIRDLLFLCGSLSFDATCLYGNAEFNFNIGITMPFVSLGGAVDIS